MLFWYSAGDRYPDVLPQLGEHAAGAAAGAAGGMGAAGAGIGGTGTGVPQLVAVMQGVGAAQAAGADPVNSG